jgi:trimethylamine--corrinoid protein Co-methyltransferase
MTGCNIIGAAGMIESGLTASFEEMVLDDEYFDMIYRLIRGVELTEESLAVDVIKKVGPGGHFLSDPHTVKYATNEVWYPRLLDRQNRNSWEKTGAKTIERRANEKAKQILRDHKSSPLEKSVRDEIFRIVKDAERILLK